MGNNTTSIIWKNHEVSDLSTLKGKKVIVRVDWNLPVVDGVITDTSRFDVSVPFLQQLSFVGAKIILLTHFGEKGESLSVVANHVTKTLPFVSFFPSENFDTIHKKIENVEKGGAVLLENVRRWEGELENSSSLAQSFASLGDIFINDAFSVCHRKHASVVGIAEKMLSYFGPTCLRELENLTKALTPEKPALLIVGGAKISTKMTLIQKYLDEGVNVFVGGAMVHNILKERGLEIGKSLYDAECILSQSFVNHPLLLTPSDVVLEDGSTVLVSKIPESGKVVDCGSKTIDELSVRILTARTVIVNGPLGLYENGWLHGSEQILTKLAHTQTISYIGGGDTVTVAHKLHLLQKFTFVSLGGGAMLEFLANGTLPGIDAVTK